MGQIDASPAVKSLESNAEHSKLAASVKEANKKKTFATKSLPPNKKPVQKETSIPDKEKRKEKLEKLTEEQISELEVVFTENPETDSDGFPESMKYTSLAESWDLDRLVASQPCCVGITFE